MKEFNELLNKYSLYFEPIPQYQRTAIGEPWNPYGISILLQKKIPIPEDEEVKDAEIVSPVQANDLK